MMRALLSIAFVLFGAIPASAAEEPSGCDKFKWPIERERAALAAPDRLKIASGDDLKPALPVAAIVSLRPAAEANLPTTPERIPAANTFLGFAIFKNALPPGRYTINLSAAGWIDVVQDGRFLRSVTSSGVRGCEGIRKSVKFEIPPKPFTIQISGVEANSISLAIVPASE
jgi:hypothetical protein